MPLILAVLAAFVLGLGCSGSSPYACTLSSECVDHATTGICDHGFCAFPDTTCGDGFRFEPNAGDGLGGTCAMTDAGMPPTPCGGFGEACCATGPACAAGATCETGTCQACVTEVALGRWFSCEIARDHTVSCSGSNAVGQLGLGIPGAPSATPVQVRDSTSVVISDAVGLGAGRDHACVIRTGGTVWCWGLNTSGQIGNATTAMSTSPSVPSATQVVKTGGVPLANIVEVAVGDAHTCARDANGGVWCWGGNGSGQLGDGTTTLRNTAAPVLVAMMGSPFTGVIDLDMTASTTCARKTNGEAWCWGKNGEGQLGDNTTTDWLVPKLLAMSPSIGAGHRHVCWVNADTTISCSGSGEKARLGNATATGYYATDTHVPVQVLASPGGAAFTGAAKVGIGGASCAIKQDTSVWCWGDSRYGETGTGQGEIVPAPLSVEDKPLDKVDRLVANRSHVCAHRTTGQWLCWGRNSQGDLGDGTFLNRAFPMTMAGSCR